MEGGREGGSSGLNINKTVRAGTGFFISSMIFISHPRAGPLEHEAVNNCNPPFGNFQLMTLNGMQH